MVKIQGAENPLGICRIGTDSKTSVVDSIGRSRTHGNLFIIRVNANSDIVHSKSNPYDCLVNSLHHPLNFCLSRLNPASHDSKQISLFSANFLYANCCRSKPHFATILITTGYLNFHWFGIGFAVKLLASVIYNLVKIDSHIASFA